LGTRGILFPLPSWEGIKRRGERGIFLIPLVPKLQLGNALPGKLQLPSCYS